jgi:hypothetical protein
MHIEGDPVDGKEGRASCEHRGGASTSVRVDADPNQPCAFCVGDDELVLAEGDPLRAKREAELEDPGSEQSPSVTDWSDGGFVGIHGTNQPELLPGPVLHGCIRLRNADILDSGASCQLARRSPSAH